MVSVIKQTMTKCSLAKKDPQMAFLILCTTPLSHNLPSPAELLYARPIRSILLSVVTVKYVNEKVKEIVKTRQENEKKYYDPGTHELKPGEAVMLQSHNSFQQMLSHRVRNLDLIMFKLWTVRDAGVIENSYRNYHFKSHMRRTLNQNYLSLKLNQPYFLMITLSLGLPYHNQLMIRMQRKSDLMTKEK